MEGRASRIGRGLHGHPTSLFGRSGIFEVNQQDDLHRTFSSRRSSRIGVEWIVDDTHSSSPSIANFDESIMPLTPSEEGRRQSGPVLSRTLPDH